LDAGTLKRDGGPAGQFNIASMDGRIAEAMRDGHIPAAPPIENTDRFYGWCYFNPADIGNLWRKFPY
jgi:hypothetical protein